MVDPGVTEGRKDCRQNVPEAGGVVKGADTAGEGKEKTQAHAIIEETNTSAALPKFRERLS